VGSTLIERVLQTGSLVIRKLGHDRAGEMAIHRFLSAPSVTTGEMVATLAARTVAACAGRQIIAVQDTTEVNFAGREACRRGLGPAGDGVSTGFFMHPLMPSTATPMPFSACWVPRSGPARMRSPPPRPAPVRSRTRRAAAGCKAPNARRAGPVVIARPRGRGERTDPAHLTLTLVRTREVDGPADRQTLVWRLLTTRCAIAAADAQDIVRLYRLR
jgi:hypothetical protein